MAIPWIDVDNVGYQRHKVGIDYALYKFKQFQWTKKNIFYELIYVLLVPQSRALSGDKAVRALKQMNFLSSDISISSISKILRESGVRFHQRKSQFVDAVRKLYTDKEFWNELSSYHTGYTSCVYSYSQSIYATNMRAWLVSKIKGLGYKTASQFLRNIGITGLCILDVHILDGLEERGLINKKKGLTKKDYCSIEKSMQKYAEESNLPVDALDLLWWQNKTGFIFR